MFLMKTIELYYIGIKVNVYADRINLRTACLR